MLIGRRRATKGSSSGLHHDFHDNVYILIKGRKRFTLFSPDDALHLHTKGKIRLVHPNGLINYRGNVETRQDGLNLVAARSHRISTIKKEIGLLQDLIETSKKRPLDSDHARNLLSFKRRKLSNLQSEWMSLCADSDDFEDDFRLSDDDEQDRKDEDSPIRDQDDDQEKEEEQEEEEEVPLAHFSEIPTRLLHPLSGIGKGHNKETERKKRKQQQQQQQEEEKMFPGLKKAKSHTVFVEAGQMLFLPCGWFHEVTSFSPKDDRNHGHMAFNFWFHPPSTTDFDHPYDDDFWETHLSSLL